MSLDTIRSFDHTMSRNNSSSIRAPPPGWPASSSNSNSPTRPRSGFETAPLSANAAFMYTTTGHRNSHDSVSAFDNNASRPISYGAVGHEVSANSRQTNSRQSSSAGLPSGSSSRHEDPISNYSEIHAHMNRQYASTSPSTESNGQYIISSQNSTAYRPPANSSWEREPQYRSNMELNDPPYTTNNASWTELNRISANNLANLNASMSAMALHHPHFVPQQFNTWAQQPPQWPVNGYGISNPAIPPRRNELHQPFPYGVTPPNAMPSNNMPIPPSLLYTPAPARVPVTKVTQLLADLQSRGSASTLDLKSIRGYVIDFTGDQNGSRFLQEKLATATTEEKDMIFNELDGNEVVVMRDLFGNYVMQKFFDYGTQLQKRHLAACMKGRIVELAMNSYGCRVVQTAFGAVLTAERQSFIEELRPNIISLSRDPTANHVVQKAIEVSPSHEMGFLMDRFRGNFSEHATNQFVCRVIQRMLERFLPEDKRVILNEIHAAASTLIMNQYGNYVIQHIIRHGKDEDRNRMIKLVLDDLIVFCKHKFASNVVEACIEKGDNATRSLILKMMTDSVNGNSILPSLMRDSYGNYVTQTLLTKLYGAEQVFFSGELKRGMDILGNSLGAKQRSALEIKLQEVYNAIKKDQEANSQSSTGPPKSESSSDTGTKTPKLSESR